MFTLITAGKLYILIRNNHIFVRINVKMRFHPATIAIHGTYT